MTGVLLPLQLETVFAPPKPPERPTWRVRLRVIPQPPSVVAPVEHVSEHELAAVTRFRRAMRRTGRLSASWFGTEAHLAAFLTLAETVGFPRATWLALHTTARRVDGALKAEAVAAAADGPSEVRGLPPRLKVVAWTYQGGAEVPVEIGTLPQDGGSIASRLPLPDLGEANALFGHWIVDWPAARRVGLGGEFDLPAGWGPAQLGGIGVWGIGGGPVGAHLAAQVDSGFVGEVPLGAATNTVAGGPTPTTAPPTGGTSCPEGAPDPQGWWSALLRRLGGGQPSSLDDAVARYVAGESVPSIARPSARDDELSDSSPDAKLLDFLMGEFGASDPEGLLAARAAFPKETALAPLLMQALWPVLWGSFVRDEWQGATDPALVSRWILRNVHPEGPLPALRFGDQPYALLPITTLHAPPEPDEPDGLRDLLISLRRELHAGLLPGGTVDGRDAAGYAELLFRGGSSRSFGARWAVRDSIAQALHPAAYAPARRARDEQLAALGLVDHVDPLIDGQGQLDTLGLELVQATRSSFWGVEGLFRRLPLPALVEALIGDGFILRPMAAFTTLAELFSAPVHFAGDTADPSENPIGLLPDSLLARLLVQSVLTAADWRQGGDPLLDLDRGYDRDAWRIAALQVAAAVDPGDGDQYSWRRADRWWEARAGEEVPLLAGSSFQPDFPSPAVPQLARLERAFGATLDTFSTRLDPWVTAFAWRRLREESASPPPRQLGAYGWLFGPFGGEPGPTASGLLHTPSSGQTTVATLARDSYLHNREHGIVNEQGETPWEIGLTGRAVRIANDIVADLRDGHDIHDVLGREVERIVGASSTAPYTAIRTLRATYPLYPARPDPRQVADGVAALSGLLGAGTLPPEAQRSLRELKEGVEALADLTLLDGALASSSREPARASAAMDAAAGSGAFPEPRYPQTPASGREISTTVVSVVPWRDAEAGATAARLAEPTVAALLDDRLGADWTWDVRWEDGAHGTVTLGTLGLRPIDTLALGAEELRRLAATAAGARGAAVPAGEGTDAFEVAIAQADNGRWGLFRREQLLGTASLTDLGLAPEDAAALHPDVLLRRLRARFRAAGLTPTSATTIRPVAVEDSPRVWTVRDQLGNLLAVHDADSLGLAGDDRELPLDTLAPRIRGASGVPRAVVTDPPELARAARLVGLLGSPATGRDLDPAAPAEAPTAYAELRARYAAVHAELRATTAALTAAERSASDGERALAVRRAALWGLGAGLAPADRAGFDAVITGTPAPKGATTLRALTRSLRAALWQRRDAVAAPNRVPSVAAHASEIGGSARERGLPDGVGSLARELSRLVAPQGNLPVLVEGDRAALVDGAGLLPGDGALLEGEWLTVVAPVRPALARVEAWQLASTAAGAGGLDWWTNAPDPWRRAEIAALSDDPARRLGRGFDVAPVLLALGPPGALEQPRVAVGVVDAYTEWLPLRSRNTQAAFGFNAPAARAPQAILLAVPPSGEELTEDGVGAMLAELRELVVARGALASDVAGLSPVLPTILTPSEPGYDVLGPSESFLR